MDVQWQIDIINGLIKENPDSTIKDYIELLQVLTEIEQEYGDTFESRERGPAQPVEGKTGLDQFASMTDRLTISEYKALKKKKPKYRNEKASYNGIQFPSIKERDRYKDLLLMEQAGEIAHLRCQVTFPLYVNGKLICSYKADFVYVDLKLGREVIEDSKGFRTKEFRIKAKLFAALHEHPILET